MNNKIVFALEPPQIICQSFSENLAIGQCDACSPIIFAKNGMPQPNSPNVFYYSNPTLIKQTITPNNYTVLSPFTKTFYVLNESAMSCLQHFKSPQTLENIPSTWSETWGKPTVQSTLEQMIILGLLMPENTLQNKFCAPVEVPNTLAAWLHITDRCNLRCTYCYLLHNNTDMSPETGRAAIEVAFRSAVAHNYREVKLKYAGGESLLRFSFIKELHRYAQVLAEQHGLALDGVVLSNGTLLTAETVREMQALGLRLMISLDNLFSPNSVIQRVYPNGRDSADDVMRAVELALDYGLTPDISITVSGRNVGGLPGLLAWVLERDLPFSLNFYRVHERCSKLETGNWKLEEDKLLTGLLAAYNVIETNLPQRSLLASLVDLANFAAPHLRRCSVGHSYLVFDCTGRISKCQMQMEKSVTGIHADDPLAMIQADEAGIQNLSVDEKKECQSCQWRYWCAGGCPLETFRATGRYDIKSPNCNIYKALYPEVLRLEGLRLLKYSSSYSSS